MGEKAFEVPDDASPDYRRLYDTHYAPVLAYCARRVGRQDAPDLVSEVFAVAWRRMDAIPHDNQLPWLYGVSYKVVSRHWRTRGRRMRLVGRLSREPTLSVPEPDVQVVRSAEYELLIRAFQRLRAKDQEILRLAVWEELRHEQIAGILGCSIASARQRFHRAKRSLLKEYRRLGGAVPASADAPKSVAPEGGES